MQIHSHLHAAMRLLLPVSAVLIDKYVLQVKQPKISLSFWDTLCPSRAIGMDTSSSFDEQGNNPRSENSSLPTQHQPFPPAPSCTCCTFLYSSSSARCISKSACRSFLILCCSMSRITPACIACRSYVSLGEPAKPMYVDGMLTAFSEFCW